MAVPEEDRISKASLSSAKPSSNDFTCILKSTPRLPCSIKLTSLESSLRHLQKILILMSWRLRCLIRWMLKTNRKALFSRAGHQRMLPNLHPRWSHTWAWIKLNGEIKTFQSMCQTMLKRQYMRIKARWTLVSVKKSCPSKTSCIQLQSRIKCGFLLIRTDIYPLQKFRRSSHQICLCNNCPVLSLRMDQQRTIHH